MLALAQNARIVLRWKDVPGASAYEVQIAKDAAFVEVVLQTRTTVAGYRWEQLPTQTHWWRVRSFDAEGRASEWSAPRTLAVDSAIPTPLKPADGASVSCGSTVTLELDASALVKEYLVELSVASDFSSIRTLRSADPTFELPGLSAGAWYWRTRAVDIKGRTTDTGPVRSFVVKVSPPRPRSVGDVLLGVPQVNLTWAEAGCAASYLVEAMHDGKDKVTIPAPGTSLAFKAGVAGEYRWRVASVDERGTPGEFSAESVFRVKLATPGNRAEVVGPRVELSWSSVPTATGYKVELMRGTQAVAAPTVPATTWKSAELTPGDYKWRVTARDALGHTSSPSEWRSFFRPSANALQLAKWVQPSMDAVVPVDAEVELEWAAVPEAVAYEVELDGVVSKVDATRFKTPALKEGGHEVRLRALGPMFRTSDWTSPLELFAGTPAVSRAEVSLVGEQIVVRLFDAKGRAVSGGEPRFRVESGTIAERERLAEAWQLDWSPPFSGKDTFHIDTPGFHTSQELVSTLDPFTSTAVRAGGIFNAGAVASPYVGVGLTIRFPFLMRRPGFELRVGVAHAGATADLGGGAKLEGGAWLLPIGFLLAWHHNVGAFQLKAGAGAVAMPLWVTVGAESSFRALPGFEGVLSLSRRLGPGRLEGEVSFLYSRLEIPLARLNAGGLAIRVGYAFDL